MSDRTQSRPHPQARSAPDPALPRGDLGEDAAARKAVAEATAARPPADELPHEPSREDFSALFGSCKRSGDWWVADQLHAWACFGEVHLDFTEADLPAHGEIEIDCDAIFGQVILVVPRDAEVEIEGTRALFGEVKETTEGRKLRSFVSRLVTGDPSDADTELADEEPLYFRVSGTVIFGGVEVKRV